MKKILFALLALSVLVSCNNDDDSHAPHALLGDWILVEILADPGDGSGTFQPVESDKTITFKPNGLLTSNGNLCQMDMTTGTATSGKYSLSSSTFSSSDCSSADYPFTFEQQGDLLIINYPCIEPCKAKYKKT